MKRQIVLSIAIFFFLLLGTAIVVLYGRGYRFGFDKGRLELSSTGLLVATSNPDGASVFVNGHITTATNNTINLLPGIYDIKIQKPGYFPWLKKVEVKKEAVTKIDALLFSVTPKLESITTSGVETPVLDPSGTQIAYTTASSSARENGIYILDMSTRPILTLQSSSSQIADDTINFFSRSLLSWSPDRKQLLATISAGLSSPTTYLLQTSGFNQNPQDVTATLESIHALWERQKAEKEKARINSLPSKLRKIVVDNFKIIAWAPDETKILYEASESANLPLVIKPRLLGINSMNEQKDIERGSLYVYDIKEDTNFKILGPAGKGQTQPPLSWLPDSRHLIYVHDARVDIMEYDGGNQTTVYAGPFVDNYAFPWPDGSKIVILTNLGNSSVPPNLYTIGLK